MKAQKFFGILVVLALLVALIPTGSVAAAVTKVPVCHYDKDAGVFFLINISDNAYDAHIAHGDAEPGDAIPGVANMKFGADCKPVRIIDLTGHWSGASGLVGSLTYTFTMDLVMADDGSVTGTIVYYGPWVGTRTVTGQLTGSSLYLNTADASYWANFTGTATSSSFAGTGIDKSGASVGITATK